MTTEDVLTEFLAFLAEQGPQFRQVATLTLRSILLDVEVVFQTHDAFLAALAYCESRPDKGYSLTDCVSMSFMHARGITDVLTNDGASARRGSARCFDDVAALRSGAVTNQFPFARNRIHTSRHESC